MLEPTVSFRHLIHSNLAGKEFLHKLSLVSLVSFPHIFNIEFVLDETVSMLGSHENQPYWNCNLFSLTQCIRYKQAYQVLLGDDKRL